MQKIYCLLICFMSATLAYADSTKDVVKALRNSTEKTQLVLKNFSGEDDVRAKWSGTGFELEPPRWRTMGVLSVDSVKLKGDKLTLKCIRHVAVRDKTDKVVLYAQPSIIDIDVDLNGARPEDVLPKLKDALFYPSVADALAALPKDVREVIPARIDKTSSQTGDSSKPKPLCDCTDQKNPDCPAAHSPTDVMVPPKYLHGNNPGFTDQARSAKLNGSVNVRLIVDKGGHPIDVWVARPLGLGLDEEAAKSVLSYVFKPSTCHGNPVAVYLSVEVPFEVH